MYLASVVISTDMEIFGTNTRMTGIVKMKTFWLKYCLISTSSQLRKELQHPPRERFVLSCVTIHIFILQFSISLSALCLFSVFRWLQLTGHGKCQGIISVMLTI